MSVSWYVEPGTDDAKRVKEEVSSRGMKALYAGGGELPDANCMYFGTVEGVKLFQGFGCRTWCDWNKLKCSYYFPRWGELLLARRYGFYPLGEVLRLGSELWRWYEDTEGRAFIRPDANDKCFDGVVVHSRNLPYWLKQAEGLPPETLCLVARPEKIYAEYRLWVVQGKVVAGSQYIFQGKIDHQQGWPISAQDLAEHAAYLWSPHAAFVLDVASEVPGKFSILECGSVHTCGLYAADVGRIVSSLSELAEREL